MEKSNLALTSVPDSLSVEGRSERSRDHRRTEKIAPRSPWISRSVATHAQQVLLARAIGSRWHAASFVQYGPLDSGCTCCHHVCAAGSPFTRKHDARRIITGSHGRGMGYVSERTMGANHIPPRNAPEKTEAICREGD